jgi:hypothetical protein
MAGTPVPENGRGRGGVPPLVARGEIIPHPSAWKTFHTPKLPEFPMLGTRVRFLGLAILVLLLLHRIGPLPVQAEIRTPPSGPTLLQDEENWEGDYLYRVALLRAAPGRILDLIELLKEERDLLADIREPLPFWMRHTQGDQWDLMILYPMGSFYEYYEPERTQRRNEYGVWKGLSYKQLQFEVGLLTSYREEVFVRGPAPEVLDAAFSHNGFYHAEMMVALAGRRARLLEERRMENRYLRFLGRPERLIFVREAGGPWDSFTLGFYRDLQHYAEAQELRADQEEMAARAAGFESADRIGSYMRSLILYHRDTLAVAIR